jgi:hypothetical protein
MLVLEQAYQIWFNIVYLMFIEMQRLITRNTADQVPCSLLLDICPSLGHFLANHESTTQHAYLICYLRLQQLQLSWSTVHISRCLRVLYYCKWCL